MTVLVNKMNVFRTNIHFGLCTTLPDHVSVWRVCEGARERAAASCVQLWRAVRAYVQHTIVLRKPYIH